MSGTLPIVLDTIDSMVRLLSVPGTYKYVRTNIAYSIRYNSFHGASFMRILYKYVRTNIASGSDNFTHLHFTHVFYYK